MIARVWRGRTAADDADEYVACVERTGLRGARALPGNRGTLVLRRRDGNEAEIVTVMLWDSLDAVRSFAGDDLDRAVFFAEDDRYLVERDEHVTHYEVDAHLQA